MDTPSKRAAPENARRADEPCCPELARSLPGIVYRRRPDADWNMLAMSDHAFTLTGYPPEEFIDGKVRAYASLIHPGDLDRVDGEVSAAIMARHPYDLEYRILHADGDIRWVHEHGLAHHDDTGAVLWLDGLITDITRSKQVEADLHAAQAKYKALFECVPLGISITDDRGHILEANPAAERLLGLARARYARNGLAGPTWNIVRADGSPMSAEEFPGVRALTEGRRIDGVELGIPGEGRTMTWINVRAEPIPLDGHGAVIAYDDITELRETKARLRAMAYHDTLTGLPNRRLLMERLGHARNTSKRSGRYGALMLLDLDDFKHLNDTLGHDVSDRLLVDVAQRLTTNVRESDTVARLGGDDFVIMLSDLDRDAVLATEQARMVGEKVRIALEQPCRLADDIEPVRSSASIGLTLFLGTEQPPDMLLELADLALHRAKTDGRNRVCV